jgi:hypothetical protein
VLRRFFNPIFLYGVALFGLMVLGGAAAARADAPLPLELNKLEPLTQGEAGCRVYFVVTNPDAETVGNCASISSCSAPMA